MKVIIILLLASVVFVSCSETNKHQDKTASSKADYGSTNADYAGDDRQDSYVLSVRDLILASDSIYLRIGETTPHKVPLRVKKKLRNKNELKLLASFLPEDTATTLIVYPIDTMSELPVPPPTRWGRPVGALEIYTNATVTRSINFIIDSTDTYLYFKNGRRRVTFTQSGDAYFRKMLKEYKGIK